MIFPDDITETELAVIQTHFDLTALSGMWDTYEPTVARARFIALLHKLVSLGEPIDLLPTEFPDHLPIDLTQIESPITSKREAQ